MFFKNYWSVFKDGLDGISIFPITAMSAIPCDPGDG